MHLQRFTLILLAFAASPAAAQDSDLVRLFSPVPNGPTLLAPPAKADQPPTVLVRPPPAIRGAVQERAAEDSSLPSSADRPWLVALPAARPMPAPFQPVR